LVGVKDACELARALLAASLVPQLSSERDNEAACLHIMTCCA